MSRIVMQAIKLCRGHLICDNLQTVKCTIYNSINENVFAAPKRYKSNINIMEKYSHLDLHPESKGYLKYLQENSNPNIQSVEEKRIERNKRYVYTTYTDRKFDLERTEIFVPSPDVKGKRFYG